MGSGTIYHNLNHLGVSLGVWIHLSKGDTPKMVLNDLTCKKAKAAEKPYKLSDSQGLYLHIMPNGSKNWRMKYRFQGKEKLLSFGPYPLISLSEARQKRDDAKKLLLEGVDPSRAKKDEEIQARLNAATTFEAVALEWHSNHLDRWSASHGKTLIHRLKTDIFPEIGLRPINEITPPELLEVIRKIEERGAHEIAHRAIQTCGQVFRYGIVTGRTERNPAADLRGALRPVKKGHYAALETDDIPQFLQDLERNDARLYQHTRLAIKLLMLTFVRTSELIGAQWSEFNFAKREWTIPAERMKMRRAHIVPLSKQAVDILNELRVLSGNREHILPSQVNPRKHMSNNTILKALERMGYKGRMTGHGFRALAMSSIKERLGYRHEVVDRQLAHAPANKIDAAYDRAQFLDERHVMMQKWANYLEEALKELPSSITPLKEIPSSSKPRSEAMH